MTKLVTFAIETSCDDTSLGIVEYEDGLFTNPLLKAYSQVPDHQNYGGVVPEVAYRLHEEKILDIIKEIWYNQIEQCDFITVTKEPGLPGSLVVGNTVATMLWEFFNKPVYRVNHIHGHIFSLLLDRNIDDCPLPRLVLTASGGHNEMYTVQAKKLNGEKAKMVEYKSLEWLDSMEIEKIGYSLDDAAGECYDKVSRMLGGSYPGGPWIDMMAKKWKSNDKFALKRILLDGKNIAHTDEHRLDNILNFSFSGMKSQVYQLLLKYPLESLSEQDVCDIAWEFLECVTDILVQKIRWAAERNHCKTFWVVGGVSASDTLYEKVNRFLPTLRPIKKIYSMDNAAMIGVVWILEHLWLISNHD